MSAPPCVVCTRPTPDGFACAADARSLAERLTGAAGHAEDAESGGTRGSRYGGTRGGSSDGVSFDPTRSAKLGAVVLAVDGWVSDLLGDEPFPAWRRTQGPLCPPLRTAVTLDDGEVMLVQCPHSSCAAIKVATPPSVLAQEFSWLSGQMRALRHHPAAAEAFRELRDACDQLARLVDTPADKVLVGMCDCGKVLYAPRDKADVRCPEPTCKLVWNVGQSRDILRKALDDKLVDRAQAAFLAQYLDGDRTQDNIGKLIDSRVRSGQLAAHGEIDSEPLYRFGEVVLMLATVPRRRRERAA